MINLSKSKTWLALPILGVIVGQGIIVGDSDEIKIIQLSHLKENYQTQLLEKLISVLLRQSLGRWRNTQFCW